MSAELQTPIPTEQATGSPQAIYFSASEHPLFGWLHRPLVGSGELGVVLCNPFGYEAICAHRGIRAFAESIASAGMPALRFDYLGTGDSPNIGSEADQVEAWTRDVLAAVEELRARTGVRQICLLGFRLGALLAARAAALNSGIRGLIAVSPLSSGRRYLKELRMTRMAGALGVDPDVLQAEKQSGGMEVSGFTVSRATLESLGKMEVSVPDLPLPPMLVVEGTNSDAGQAHKSDDTSRVALPGLVEMLMTAPQFAEVPKEAIAASISWLKATFPATAASLRDPLSPVSTGAVIMLNEIKLAAADPDPKLICTERPVHFGPGGLLFGILTRPHASETRRRAVILLNAGADHHIGASRLYVSMARRWARHGYAVLRMDLGGVGDSGTRPGRVDDNVFPLEAIEDIRSAIEFLQGDFGIRDVTLAGLCSGAYHALRAAVAGLPISRILMVNPQNYFWRRGETLEGVQLVEVVHNPGLYRSRMFSWAAWKRLITGEVNILRIAKIYLQRPLLEAESTLRNIARRLRIRLPNDLGSELEDILSRGVSVVFVFARGEPGIELLRVQAGKSVEQLAELCRIHILDSGDHVFTRSGPRETMEKVVSHELFSRPDAFGGAKANLNSRGLRFEQ